MTLCPLFDSLLRQCQQSGTTAHPKREKENSCLTKKQRAYGCHKSTNYSMIDEKMVIADNYVVW